MALTTQTESYGATERDRDSGRDGEIERNKERENGRTPNRRPGKEGWKMEKEIFRCAVMDV